MDEKDRRERRPHRLRRAIAATAIVLVALAAAFALGVHVYASDYYHAEPEAASAERSTADVTVTQLASGDVTFVPTDEPAAFLVFYPGGKVEAAAYAPLLSRLARRGVASVLVRMPENLAVLAPNRACRGRSELEAACSNAGVTQAHPWLMGGHSLGGAMAATYVAAHAGSYQGLVLLAAYSTSDLSQTGIRTLSVWGSHDGVLDRQRYEECRPNLGDHMTELVIDGGIHSYFGCYGHQAGDGEATISNDAQLDQTADAVAAFCRQL